MGETISLEELKKEFDEFKRAQEAENSFLRGYITGMLNQIYPGYPMPDLDAVHDGDVLSDGADGVGYV